MSWLTNFVLPKIRAVVARKVHAAQPRGGIAALGGSHGGDAV
jgi:hypothetical protein